MCMYRLMVIKVNKQNEGFFIRVRMCWIMPSRPSQQGHQNFINPQGRFPASQCTWKLWQHKDIQFTHSVYGWMDGWMASWMDGKGFTQCVRAAWEAVHAFDFFFFLYLGCWRCFAAGSAPPSPPCPTCSGQWPECAPPGRPAESCSCTSHTQRRRDKVVRMP